MDSDTRVLEEKIDELLFDHRDCTLCPLHKHRKVLIRGQGKLHTKIVAVVDRVSPRAAVTGNPLDGGEGKFLASVLKKAGIDPSYVWVTPVVSCPSSSLAPRPRGRIDMLSAPKPGELAACRSRLHAEINIIEPHIILAFGSAAMKGVTLRPTSVVEARGRVTEAYIQGNLVEYAVPMMVLPSVNQLYRDPSQNVGGMWNKTIGNIKDALDVASKFNVLKEDR
jgi:uracil-DNA glycosylase family 4